MIRRYTWLVAALLLSVGTPLLAQAQPVPPTPPVNETTERDTDRDSTDRYRPPPIQWQPCVENAALECGTLTVPVDYQKPRGETFGVAVVRAKNTNPAKRIGVLMTNPGGPGISGVDQVVFGVSNPLFVVVRERFDLIGFDPRGVGRSRPVQCTPGPLNLPEDRSDATLIAHFDAFGKRFAEDCLQKDGPFIAHLSTNNVARDMDVLRRALGERTITYASGSYGTQLGAVYASLFPHRLRAMALDGGIAPAFRDYYTEMTTNQLEAFETELQRIDVLCRRDAACRLRETGVVAAVDQLVAKLDAAPHTTPEGVVLRGSSVVSAVYTLIYRESAAPKIVDLLANGLAGDYTLIAQVLPTVDAGLNFGAIYAIRCNDYGTRRTAAEYLPVDEVVGARHPRFFGRFYLAYRLATCSALPAADPSIIRNIADQVKVPILLVMNDFDPATPPHEMRALAHALGMERSIIRYQGGGHTFPKNNACVASKFLDYLFNLTVPAEGTTCPGQVISFAPQTRLQSATEEPNKDPWGAGVGLR